MVTPRETFGINFTSHDQDNTNWVRRACSTQSIDHRWGVLERESDDQNSMNSINQTKGKGE